MNRCVVLDAGALSSLAGHREGRGQNVRAALRSAARLNREVVVPAVILAELYRGPRHNQVVDACLSRETGIRVRDTDRRVDLRVADGADGGVEILDDFVAGDGDEVRAASGAFDETRHRAFLVAQAHRRHRLRRQPDAGLLLEGAEVQGLAEVAQGRAVVEDRGFVEAPEAGQDEVATSLFGEAAQASEDVVLAFAETLVLMVDEDVGFVDEEERPSVALRDLTENGVKSGVAGQVERPGERSGQITAGKGQKMNVDAGIVFEPALDGLQEARLADLTATDDEVARQLTVENVGENLGASKEDRLAVDAAAGLVWRDVGALDLRRDNPRQHLHGRWREQKFCHVGARRHHMKGGEVARGETVEGVLGRGIGGDEEGDLAANLRSRFEPRQHLGRRTARGRLVKEATLEVEREVRAEGQDAEVGVAGDVGIDAEALGQRRSPSRSRP